MAPSVSVCANGKHSAENLSFLCHWHFQFRMCQMLFSLPLGNWPRNRKRPKVAPRGKWVWWLQTKVPANSVPPEMKIRSPAARMSTDSVRTQGGLGMEISLVQFLLMNYKSSSTVYSYCIVQLEWWEFFPKPVTVVFISTIEKDLILIGFPLWLPKWRVTPRPDANHSMLQLTEYNNWKKTIAHSKQSGYM